MIKKLFGFLWRTLTAIRVALANLLLIVVLVIAWEVFTDKPRPLPERAALLLNPIGQVVDERSRINTAGLLFDDGAAGSEVLLADLIDSVDIAREDPRITALVIEAGGILSMGQSKTWELSKAIERFRESGKPVVAIGDYYSQGQYRLAAEADTIFMHPFGAVALSGYGVYLNYYADALEKLSLTMHVFRAGEFKSIAEPLLRNDMSEGEREVTRRWVGDLWRAYTGRIETRRGLEAGTVDAMLNDYAAALRASGGSSATLALDTGLVDDLLSRDQQVNYLTELVGASDADGGFAAVTYNEYLSRKRASLALPAQDVVAVVTAQGNMLPGDQPPGTIGGDSLARRLRETAERRSTKAIVLRVTSGGGSVFASEIIREEMARIRQDGTPIVVSMGSIAASGGYYIATAADRILATPSTITGSIGVFAAFPTVENLFARAGVSTDGVGTTAIAGGLRLDRALDTQIADALQQGVEETYDRFLALVADARGIAPAELDQYAQGRTLSAAQAVSAGLVDALGGLEEAVVEAASLAGLAEGGYEVRTIAPEFDSRQIFLQQLSDLMGAVNPGLALRGALEPWLTQYRQPLELLDSLSDPQHLYMRCLACGPQ